MLVFRLADVPRTARRLTPPVPLMPEGAPAGDVSDEDGATPGTLVHWALRPTLLKPGSAPTREAVAQVIALYATMEGQPRVAVEALGPRIEDILEDYRLARCIARTVESMGYHVVPPPRALALEPAALRALCYQRAQERHAGYVPRARRAAFLAELATELGATAEALEADLWADRAGAALLRAGPPPLSVDALDVSPPLEPLTAAGVIAGYNAAVVSTVLAASS